MTMDELERDRLRQYHNEWYHKNKHRLAANRRKRNKDDYRARKEFIIQEKLRHGRCAECDLPCDWYTHPGFDWDHLDQTTKKFNLGDVRGQSFEAIKEELNKCRLLCKVCHSIITFQDRAWEFRKNNDDQLPIGVNKEQLQLDL